MQSVAAVAAVVEAVLALSIHVTLVAAWSGIRQVRLIEDMVAIQHCRVSSSYLILDGIWNLNFVHLFLVPPHTWIATLCNQ
eukprot:scaffold255562_cov46-Attheya_sp.AAC.1